jgi:hypothetical protein
MAKQTGPIDLIRRFKNAGALRKAGKIAKATAPELKAVAKARTTKRAEAAAKAAAKNAPAPTAGVKDLKEIKVTTPKLNKPTVRKTKVYTKAKRAAKAEQKETIKGMKETAFRNFPIATGLAGLTTYAAEKMGFFKDKPKKSQMTIKSKSNKQKTKVKKLK